MANKQWNQVTLSVTSKVFLLLVRLSEPPKSSRREESVLGFSVLAAHLGLFSTLSSLRPKMILAWSCQIQSVFPGSFQHQGLDYYLSEHFWQGEINLNLKVFKNKKHLGHIILASWINLIYFCCDKLVFFSYLHLDIAFQEFETYHVRLACPRRKEEREVKDSLSKQGATMLEKAPLFGIVISWFSLRKSSCPVSSNNLALMGLLQLG